MRKKIAIFLTLSLWLSIIPFTAVGQEANPVKKVKGNITIKKPNGEIIELLPPFEAEAGNLKKETLIRMDKGEHIITENYTLTLSNGTSEPLPPFEWEYESEAAGNKQFSVKDSVVNPISLSSWFWLKTSVIRSSFDLPLDDDTPSAAKAHIGGRLKDTKLNSGQAALNLPKGFKIEASLTGDVGGSVLFKGTSEKPLEIPKSQESVELSWISDSFQIEAGKYEIEEKNTLTVRGYGFLEPFLGRFDFPISTPWEYETQKAGDRIFHFEGSVADVHVKVKGDIEASLDEPTPNISPGNPFPLPITITPENRDSIKIGDTYAYSIDFSATWTKKSFVEKQTPPEVIILKVSAPQGAIDNIVSTGQIFTVTATVTRSSPVDEGLLNLGGDSVYASPGGKEFPSKAFKLEPPSNNVKWDVQAPETPTKLPPPKITASIKDTDIFNSIEVTTEEKGTLEVKPLEPEPSGAKDRIVSTGQEFTLKAQVIIRGAIAEEPIPTATLKIPGDSKLKDDTIQLKQPVPKDGIVRWPLIAPSTSTTDTFIVKAEGEEKNTNQSVTSETYPTVQVVKKADLTVEITEPENKSQVGPQQLFTVSALVTNRGTAGVTGKESLKIEHGGFQLEPDKEKEVQEFTVGKSVTWHIIAPAKEQKAMPITVKFQEIPLDENSGLPAVLDPKNPPSASIQIETIPEIPLQIIEPEGAKDRVVSTLQDFTLQTGKIPADFTSATLKIPKASEDKFLITDATQPISSERIVKWKVTALKETSEDIPFTVEYKRQQQTLPIKASFISIYTVTRAELSIDKIDVPNNNRDDKASVFSTGQKITINITLTKSGNAQFEKGSQGILQIEVPEDYTPGGKNEIPFSPTDSSIPWTTTAPKTLGSDSRKDAIKVTILKAPNDENSNKEAYTPVRSKETQITIERGGGLKVELSIISPDGAKDSTVSTKQEFSIQAQVIQTGAAKVKTPLLTLTLPTGYEAKGQKTIDIPLTSEAFQKREWNITAPSIKDEKIQNFTVDVKGIEENTGETKRDKNSLPIRAESAVTLKLDVKSLNTVGGIVEVNKRFIIEAIVTNEGDAKAEGKGNLKIDFGNTGVTLAQDETNTKEFTVGVPIRWSVVAPPNPKAEEWITLSPTEPWSIKDGNSGAPVLKPDPGKTKVQTGTGAITGIIKPLGATDRVVSTGQTFTVETFVLVPPGASIPTLTIDVPNGYEIIGSKSQEPVNNFVRWQVKAPPEPKTEQKITVVIKSPGQPQIENTIPITTVQAATLKISNLRISDPKGAADKTLSDGQAFIVEATISKEGDAKIEGAGEIQLSTISKPYTFIFVDDAIQRFPASEEPITVKWRLEAPKWPRDKKDWPTDKSGVITATIKTAPQDENTNEPIKQELVGAPQPIDVTIQKAAELEITELKITEPERAKSGFLRTNEQFTISATINNLGEAGIDSKGKLVLTLPEGYQPTDGLERPLELKKEILWKILAPSQPDSKSQQIDVRIDPIPNDINTNALAKVVSSVKGIPVYTPPVIPIVDLVTIQFLKGEEIDVLRGEKVDATVSTAQRFIVKNKIIVPPEVTVKTSTIILPEGGGYTLVSPETQKVSLDGTVQWTVIAPNEPKYKMQIKVFSEGEKTDGTNVKSLEPFSSVSIKTVIKAQVKVYPLEIISPDGAKDKTVSTEQTFTVQAIVGTEGDAKTIGSGKLTINAPNYKITKPEEKTFSVDEPVTWAVTAPEETVENAPIKVTITEPPKDENTWDSAAITEAIAFINTKIEPAATLKLTDFKITDIQNKLITTGQLDVKQQFYVYVSVEWNETLDLRKTPKIILKLPDNYIEDSGTPKERSLSDIINKKEKIINWIVTAPGEPDMSIQQIKVEVSPFPIEDRNTNFPAKEVVMPDPISVQTVPVVLIIKLTGPETDVPGPDQPEKEEEPWNVSTEQTFTVNAEIRAAGGVSLEQYHLRLDLPPGFTTSELLSITPVNKENKWYCEWDVTAPSNKVTEDPVKIKVTVEETGLSNEARVRLQTKAQLGASQPQIIKPPKATNKENVVSTDQNFAVKVTVTKEGEADLEGGGTIKIEAEGYTITTPERTFLPGDFLDVEGSKKFEHQWDMIAPHEPKASSDIRITFLKLPNDDNTNKTVSPPEDKRIQIEVVRKAQIIIDQITFTPSGAADGVVSTEQIFAVRVPVTVSGAAKPIDIIATLLLPRDYTSSDPTERKILPGESALWNVKAPSQKSDGQELKVRVDCTDENGGTSNTEVTPSVTTVERANVWVEKVTIKGAGKNPGEPVNQGKDLTVEVTLRNDGEATATVTGNNSDLRLEADGKNVTNEYSVNLSKKQINPGLEPLSFTLTPKDPEAQTSGTITINFNAQNSTAWDENIGEGTSVWDVNRSISSDTIKIVIPSRLAITQFDPSSEVLLKDGNIVLVMKIENRGEASAEVILNVPPETSDLVIRNNEGKEITNEFNIIFQDLIGQPTQKLPILQGAVEVRYEIKPEKGVNRDGEYVRISIRGEKPQATDKNSGEPIEILFEPPIPKVLVDTVPPTIVEATIEARDSYESGILKGTDVLTIKFKEEIKEPQKVTLKNFKLPVTGDKYGADVKEVKDIDNKTFEIELRALEMEVDSSLPLEQWTPEQWRKVREKSIASYKLSQLDISKEGGEIYDKAGNPAVSFGGVEIRFIDKWEPIIYHILPPSKTTVSTSPTISAHIEDIRGRFSSGIDATTINVIIEGEGHVIEYKDKISQYFRANTLQFPTQGLEDGTYDITIKASDRQGHEAKATVSGITVRKSDNIILDLKSYPNPFDTQKPLPSSLGDGSVFIVFSLRQPASEVTLNIYDVAGELVWAAKMNQAGSTTAGIAWDGKTLLGDTVPAGVYFCELLVKNGDKQERRYWRMASRPTPKKRR